MFSHYIIIHLNKPFSKVCLVVIYIYIYIFFFYLIKNKEKSVDMPIFS